MSHKGAVKGRPALLALSTHRFAVPVEREYPPGRSHETHPAPDAPILIHSYLNSSLRVHASVILGWEPRCVEHGVDRSQSLIDDVLMMGERKECDVLDARLDQHEGWGFPVAEVSLAQAVHHDLRRP